MATQTTAQKTAEEVRSIVSPARTNGGTLIEEGKEFYVHVSGEWTLVTVTNLFLGHGDIWWVKADGVFVNAGACRDIQFQAGALRTAAELKAWNKPKEFAAKFASKCGECGGDINAGDIVTWKYPNNARVRRNVVIHPNCYKF